MSLDWNSSSTEIQRIIEESAPDSEEFNKGVTLRDAVIWATLITGFPGDEWCLTERNWEEFYMRLHIAERVYGAYRETTERKVYFTAEEIQKCIGLRTNAGNKSRKEFNEQIIEKLRRDARTAWEKHYDEARVQVAS